MSPSHFWFEPTGLLFLLCLLALAVPLITPSHLELFFRSRFYQRFSTRLHHVSVLFVSFALAFAAVLDPASSLTIGTVGRRVWTPPPLVLRDMASPLSLILTFVLWRAEMVYTRAAHAKALQAHAEKDAQHEVRLERTHIVPRTHS